MKKARNFWRDLPQGGSRYGSVLTRLFLLLCLLATTQAGWATEYELINHSTKALTGNFICRNSLTNDNRTIAGKDFTCYVKTSDNLTSWSSGYAEARTIDYDIKTTSTTFTIYVGNTSSDTPQLYYVVYDESTSAHSKPDVTQTAIGAVIPKGNSTAQYTTRTVTITRSKNARICFYTNKASNTQIYQIIANETGTDLPKVGEAGYTLNLNKGRFALNESKNGKVDNNIEIKAYNSYTMANGAYVQLDKDKESSVYISFTTPANPGDLVLTYTKSASSAQMAYNTSASDEGATSITSGTAYTLSGNTKYFLVNTGSANCNITNLKFQTPTSTAPTAPTFSPASGSLKQNAGTVTATSSTSGSTIYYKWSSSSTTETFNHESYSTDGWTAGTAGDATATATAPDNEGTYYLNAVAYKDGEASTVSKQAYTIDGTAPTLSSSNPENNATGVATSGNITLTFSENVTIKDASKFTLSGGTLGTISASGSTVTIPYSGLSNGTPYTLSTAAGAVQDAAGNTNAALSNISFTTVAAEESLTAVGIGTFFNISNWTEGTITSTKKYATNGSTTGSPKTIEFVANSSNGVEVATNNSKTIGDESFTKRLKLNGTGNSSYRYIHFKVSGPCKISAYAYSGKSGRNLKICQGAFSGTDLLGGKGTCIDYTKLEANYTGAGESDIYIYSSSSNISVYGIKIESAATAYAITKPSSTNGSVSTKVGDSEVTSAVEGAIVTVTATPESGYKTASIVVTKTTGGETVETSGSGNTRTFTMPAEGVTVTTTFAKIVKQNVTLAWATSGPKTLTVGETYNNAATATAAEDGVLGTGVTYTSSNHSVATVSSTGVVTAVATGTAIITASFASTEYYNAATDITYTVTVEAAVVASGKTWDFTTMSTADQTAYQDATTYWSHSSSTFFSNLFEAEKNTASDYSGTGITQIEGLKYIRTGSSLSTNNIQIYKPTNSADGYLKTAGGSGRGIVIPASYLSTGMVVNVEFDGTNTSYGFTLTNAKETNSETSVSSILSGTRDTKSFRVVDGSKDIEMFANSTNVKLYKIVLGSAVTVAAPTITLADPATYKDGDASKSTTFTTNETAEGTKTTYYVIGTSAATSAATVAAGTEATSGEARNLNLSSYVSGEQDVVISAVTTLEKDGTTYYSDIVTATYTYDGVRAFKVKAADKTIQVGYRDNVDPYITYKDDTRFEIGEDEQHTLSDYFTFSYAISGDADITVDDNGVITVAGSATAGDQAIITITALPKPLGEPRFGNTPKEGTMTVTVKAKNDKLKMRFYWDPECTQEVTGPGDSFDWKYGPEGGDEENRSIFNAAIQNGRMIYVKPADGYEVWVATKKSTTPDDDSVETPTASRGTSSSTNFNTVHGIPLYISEGSGTLVIGLKSFISATGVEDGYAVSARFNIVNTNPEKRPEGPSFDPTQEAVPNPNTSQTIAAVGEDETSEVFSKFGTKTMSLGQFINYTAGTQYGKGTVATFSTEVGKRHIQAVQVVGSGKEWYISDFVTTTADYSYKLAGKLLVSPTVYYANVKEAFAAPVLTKITTDQAEEPQASDYTTPTLTGYFFNKQKSEAGSAPYQGLTFGGDNNPHLSYSIEPHDGAEATINATTGAVTIGSKSGYAIVTVNYAGGEEYTIETKAVGKKTVTTSPATITYRINILDPTEHVPTISPASKNFANSQEVKVTADDWDAYYTIDGTEPTASNGTLVKAGETATFTVGELAAIGTEITVKAIAYDSDAATYGKLVDETYTKVTPLHLPVLAPYGTEASPYTFTSATQAITAYAQDAGADVYFTTDGTDPRDGKGLKYDGSSKIVITGTATVKAAAYKDGIYSDVVTGYYVHTDNLVAPWFLKDGTKVETTPTSVTSANTITISNGREGNGSVYYYTLDGSNPTASTGQKYTDGFHIYKTVTAKVIAVENGLVSPITTVVFEVAAGANNYWEANSETTPSGKMNANYRKVSAAAHTAASPTASIYVANLTATFGGFDNNGWSNASIGEANQGAPVDGVGTYSVRNEMDTKDELGENYTPASVNLSTVHGRTYKLPSQGSYVKFEPEYDGKITVWVLQQGGLHYNNDGDFCNRFIRFRPVFIVDEQGNSITATTSSTARLSENFNKVASTNWLPKNEDKQNGETNTFYTDAQNDAIYNMYSDHIANLNGDMIAPFEATEEVYDAIYGDGNYSNVHGYVMPSGGNVRYTFDVKGGKTYFFFGHNTKLCIRGFNFEPTSTSLGEAVTLPQTTDATTFISTNKGKTKNVTLSRKMKAGIWTTFCLPFSVSATQMENIFGEGVQVMQFDKVDGTTINLFKHYHRMIVAGTPIMVKPKTPMDNITFTGVHIENIPAETINDDSGVGGYEFVGSYTPIDVTKDSYYMGADDGKWYRLTADKATLNGTRAFLHLIPGNSAKSLSYRIASIYDEEDEDVTTGIIAIENDGGNLNGITENGVGFDNNVYNTQGQIVRRNATSIEGLPKGIYIVNGKKVSVK